MLNGMMINVSESEHEAITQGLEALLANVDIGTEQKLDIESLHEELSNHMVTFNPAYDIVERQQIEIQKLNTLLERAHETIGEHREMIGFLALFLDKLDKHLGNDVPRNMCHRVAMKAADFLDRM
tara:strand:- start:775 stop:1149 length:375 start_codon:yes stop_codon:yes gene_type:complete